MRDAGHLENEQRSRRASVPGVGSLASVGLETGRRPCPLAPLQSRLRGDPRPSRREAAGDPAAAGVSLSPPLRLPGRRRRDWAGGGARAQERRSRCRGYLHLGGGRGGGPGREAEAGSVSPERGRLRRLAASSRLPGAPQVRGGPPSPQPPAAPGQRAPASAGPRIATRARVRRGAGSSSSSAGSQQRRASELGGRPGRGADEPQRLRTRPASAGRPSGAAAPRARVCAGDMGAA